jgi:hypothetical protein
MGLIKSLVSSYRKSQRINKGTLEALLSEGGNDTSPEEETITEKIKRKGFPLMISYADTRYDN